MSGVAPAGGRARVYPMRCARAGVLVLQLALVAAPAFATDGLPAPVQVAKGPKRDKGPPWAKGTRAEQVLKDAERTLERAQEALEQAQPVFEIPSSEPEAALPSAPEPGPPPETRTAPSAPRPDAAKALPPLPASEAAPAHAPEPAAASSGAPWLAGLALAALAALAAFAAWRRMRERRGRADAPAPGEATLVEPALAPASARASVRAIGAGGRYELGERIGAGGMGVVYRARDLRLERDVALKRLSEQLVDHPKAVRYFQREARAVAALNHRNVVTLYDVDEDDGVPFLTMELLEGWNLSKIVSMRGPFSSADTARLGAQAAAGLACAHAHGIVHRDVKSGNLFLTRERILKVMDFGLAKVAEELRRSGTVVGTPQYIAPEQAAGNDVDARADLYALGVTLFQLVTSRYPFEEGDLLHHHRHTPAPDPRSIRPDVAPELAELILACLAKEPEKRPATADEVSRRLRALVAR